MSVRLALTGEASLEGKGLHTGEPARLTLKPGEPGRGIAFVRVDLPGRPSIPARVQHASGSDRGTTLAANGAEVHTVEHVLSALHGLGVDDAVVELTGQETPAADGSALPYVALIRAAGTTQTSVPRVAAPPGGSVYVNDGEGRVLSAQPFDGLVVSYTLDYRTPRTLTQYASFEITPETYERDVAPARTFCLEEELDGLRAAGLIRGGSIENAVVLKRDGTTSSPLRFPNEPARHKILDLVGDLALSGAPLRAAVIGCRTGHAANQRLARALASAPAAGRDPAFPSTDPAELAALAKKLPLESKDLMRILPHRFPFLFVDRLVEFVPGERAVGLKNVSINEAVFQGHFPGEPFFPGVLILEALAQVGAVIVLSKPENAGKLALFAAVKDARFRRPVRPGDQLRLEVSGLRLKGRIGSAAAKAFVEGQLVAEAEVWFAFADRGEAKP